MPESPEQKPRRAIDAGLTAAGWIVQDRDDLDLTAGRGIAVERETRTREAVTARQGNPRPPKPRRLR
jgi:type I site-specific restriction endonuclease